MSRVGWMLHMPKLLRAAKRVLKATGTALAMMMLTGCNALCPEDDAGYYCIEITVPIP
jgi:hypothetical protein